MKPIRNSQLYQLFKTQLLLTIREPEVLFWGMIFPVLISIGLGMAFMQPAESTFRVMVVEKEQTKLDSLLALYATSVKTPKGVVQQWPASNQTLGKSLFTFSKNDWDGAIISLKRGEADLIVTDSAGEAKYHFDPLNAQSQLAYMKLSALIQSTSSHLEAHSSKALSSTSDCSSSLDDLYANSSFDHNLLSASNIRADNGEVEPLTLKGVRYIDFLIPGLIAFGLMSSIMWGVSYTIIERRSQKLLKRMIATPMKKSNFLFALMFVRILMNVVESSILFFFAWLLFDIQIQGNIGALVVLFLAGNLAFTGIAILVASRTTKTEVGSGWINAVQMPMMLLSGIFFSYHNFPEWSIGAIQLLPLTALTDGIRSIFNEGAGWIEIIYPTCSLSAFGLICFTIGMKLFKWN